MNEFLNGLPWAVIIPLGSALIIGSLAMGATRKSITQMSEDIDGHGDRLVAVEKQAKESQSDLAKQVEQNRMDLAMFKLTAAETYVRAADLSRMEDRLAERLAKVEHTVSNTMTRIVSIISGNREP